MSTFAKHALTLSAPRTLVFGRGTGLVHGVIAVMLLASVGFGLLLDRSAEKTAILHLALTAVSVFLWWMLVGARAIAISWQAYRLDMPNALAPLPATLALAWCTTVLIPAALLGAIDHNFLQSLAVLTLVACTSLCWASGPNFLVLLSFVPGLLSRFLSDFDLELGYLFQARYAGLTALALCLLTTLFWMHWFRRGAPASSWIKPMAIAFLEQVGMSRIVSAEQLRRQQAQSSRIMRWTMPRLRNDLARNPDEALRFGLGPAFGGTSLLGMVKVNGWLLLVCAFWLILYAGRPLDGGNRTALIFPALMLVFGCLMPLARLWVVYRYPQQGLSELALLPGLPRGKERPTAMLNALLHQQVANLLFAWATMALYGLVLGAPLRYYLALVWIGSAAVVLQSWLGMLTMLRRLHGMVLLLVQLVLVIATLWMMSQIVIDNVPWAITACSVFLIAITIACELTRRALLRQPHPWLAE